MKKILASAYDVNPYKGSESGTGWNFIFQISKFNKVIAVTRKNNKSHIDRYIKENQINTDNIDFYYYDLPYVLRFWKRGSRGSFLYYNLWQFFLPFYILKNNIKFDISQHINFHADHVPSFLWLIPKPFIWGPINHNEPIKRQFINSSMEFFLDRLKFSLKWIRWNLDPFFYLCRYRASIIIGSSNAVKKRLRVDPDKFIRLTTVSAQIPEMSNSEKKDKLSNNSKNFTILSVGRLVSIKSFDISIKAFDKFYISLDESKKNQTELLIVGSGPLLQKLKLLAHSMESASAINFIEWVDQKKLYDIYRSSSLLLVPSHEGAGAVVAEGLSYGLPVVCFDNFGAGEIVNKSCARKVKIDSLDNSINNMAREIKDIFTNQELLTELQQGAYSKFISDLSWDSKGEALKRIYKNL